MHGIDRRERLSRVGSNLVILKVDLGPAYTLFIIHLGEASLRKASM